MTSTSTSIGGVGSAMNAKLPACTARMPSASGFRELCRACVYATLICAPMLAGGAWLIRIDYAEHEAARLARETLWSSHDRLISTPPQDVLAVDPVIRGKGHFESACAACHKTDGTGVGGLGKNLTRSWFVASQDDVHLRVFIAGGRAAEDAMNTTKVPMPPKGNRPDLTDADLADIVAYMRGLQDPRRMPHLPASAFVAAPHAPPTADEKARALAAAGGDEELAGYIASGTGLFARTCAACHGPDAKGLKNLGKDLTTSEFVLKSDDDTLLNFISKGLNPGEPGNTTGVAMPPKGGNPALTEDDLLDVIAFLRTLTAPTSTASAAK